MAGQNNFETTVLSDDHYAFRDTVVDQMRSSYAGVGAGGAQGQPANADTAYQAFGTAPVPYVNTSWQQSASDTSAGYYTAVGQQQSTQQATSAPTWQQPPGKGGANAWQSASGGRPSSTWQSVPTQSSATVITASDRKLETTNRVLIGLVVALIIVAVVAVAVVLTFVMTPKQDAGPSPVTAPATVYVPSEKTEESATKVDESSKQAEWHDNTGNTGSGKVVSETNGKTLTEAQAYDALKGYYELAGEYDSQVAACADDFNVNYLNKDLSVRKTKAAKASSLKQKIKASWDDLKDVQMPFLSKNTKAYESLCTLYECLWHRIDVIDRSWMISLNYDKPEEHKDEILEPIRDDQVGGNNKYYTKFKDLYPTINLVKP